jgi:hypothetical protein
VEARHGVEQAAEANGEERADGQLRHQLAQEVGRHAVLALGALAVHNVALPREGVWREGDQQLEHAIKSQVEKPIWTRVLREVKNGWRQGGKRPGMLPTKDHQGKQTTTRFAY